MTTPEEPRPIDPNILPVKDRSLVTLISPDVDIFNDTLEEYWTNPVGFIQTLRQRVYRDNPILLPYFEEHSTQLHYSQTAGWAPIYYRIFERAAQYEGEPMIEVMQSTLDQYLNLAALETQNAIDADDHTIIFESFFRKWHKRVDRDKVTNSALNEFWEHIFTEIGEIFESSELDLSGKQEIMPDLYSLATIQAALQMQHQENETRLRYKLLDESKADNSED
jgi:hypothetical protein